MRCPRSGDRRDWAASQQTCMRVPKPQYSRVVCRDYLFTGQRHTTPAEALRHGSRDTPPHAETLARPTLRPGIDGQHGWQPHPA